MSRATHSWHGVHAMGATAVTTQSRTRADCVPGCGAQAASGISLWGLAMHLGGEVQASPGAVVCSGQSCRGS